MAPSGSKVSPRHFSSSLESNYFWWLMSQSSARPSIWFETNAKTCLHFWFLSIPIPRHAIISSLNWDQYQDYSWFVIHFKIVTKTSIDSIFHLRRIPRVLFLRLTISILIQNSIPMGKKLDDGGPCSQVCAN